MANAAQAWVAGRRSLRVSQVRRPRAVSGSPGSGPGWAGGAACNPISCAAAGAAWGGGAACATGFGGATRMCFSPPDADFVLDLQREYDLARSQPRHLLPASKLPTSIGSPQPNLTSLLDSLRFAQHVLEMYRRTLPQGPDRRLLDRLANRLTKITSEIRNLTEQG
ncbi:MAG: hypothetical protein ACLQU1_13240 [Bryobacteraceae bacterium]